MKAMSSSNENIPSEQTTPNVDGVFQLVMSSIAAMPSSTGTIPFEQTPNDTFQAGIRCSSTKLLDLDTQTNIDKRKNSGDAVGPDETIDGTIGQHEIVKFIEGFSTTNNGIEHLIIGSRTQQKIDEGRGRSDLAISGQPLGTAGQDFNMTCNEDVPIRIGHTKPLSNGSWAQLQIDEGRGSSDLGIIRIGHTKPWIIGSWAQQQIDEGRGNSDLGIRIGNTKRVLQEPPDIDDSEFQEGTIRPIIISAQKSFKRW